VFKLSVAILGAVVLCFAAITYIALESDDVIVVETIDHSDGGIRRTHIWHVSENDQLILEAGNPMNPWVRDVELQPDVRIVGDNLDGEYRLNITRDSARHKQVRSLMERKYGWRDVWVSMLFDSSNSMLLEANPRLK